MRNSRFGQLEAEIDHIEIPHTRTRQRKESLTEEDHAIFRLELRKSMWIARFERPGAIYDASAAAQTFPVGKMVDILEEREELSENGENGISRKKEWFLSHTGICGIFTWGERTLAKCIF